MILTGSAIAEKIGGDIIIEPFNLDRINPNSYNLRLDKDCLLFNGAHTLDMREDIPGINITLRKDEPFILEPSHLLLAQTMEYTETHNLIPQIDGRSSGARLGLTIHQTGGYGDIGYKGTWTLEITAAVPVKIYAYVEIAQISYHLPSGDTSMTYKGKYQGSRKTTSSRLHAELR